MGKLRCLMGIGLMAAVALAHAVSGHAWKGEQNGDPDRAAAIAALDREDWQASVAALERIVARRSWDEDAHTLLGFAYRKLENYSASLDHYRRALDLDPYHRGALEYLGEAHLELGDAARAEHTLARLAAACRRVFGHRWRAECPEWQELAAALRAHGVH